MRNRWIRAALVVAALALSACAPQQGADGSSAPADATPSSNAAAPSDAVEPTQTERPEASESAGATPAEGYDY